MWNGTSRFHTYMLVHRLGLLSTPPLSSNLALSYGQFCTTFIIYLTICPLLTDNVENKIRDLAVSYLAADWWLRCSSLSLSLLKTQAKTLFCSVILWFGSYFSTCENRLENFRVWGTAGEETRDVVLILWHAEERNISWVNSWRIISWFN